MFACRMRDIVLGVPADHAVYTSHGECNVLVTVLTNEQNAGLVY
jgi:hypothetical protein